MRKLREAAVVAAVVGGVSMAGAGVATAGGWEPPEANITCTQTNGDTSGDTDLGGLLDLGSGGGSADTRNQQNNCGIGIIGNDQQSGAATGGDGGALVGA